ncbi:MAG: CoA transferase, partial [Papillibacter sp.]|nr:CoA transferase [Papillibacter sp.]
MNNTLKGITVIELGTFIAVPACARFFADNGAEVIKIEPNSGDPVRWNGVSEGRPDDPYENTTYDLENANKRCIVLNLKHPKGREVLFKLLDKADIFLTNWRPQALEKNGLSYETLHEKYPKLVYGTLTGYGDKGPDKDLPGFDFTAYFARGGFMGSLYQKDTWPMNLIPGIGDHQAGLFLAAGVMAA